MIDAVSSKYIPYNGLSISPGQSVDYWLLMEDGSLAYDGDGWLKDSNGNYILDAQGNRIGAQSVQGGLQAILGITNIQAVAMLKDQKFELRDDGTYWTHAGNNNAQITLGNAHYRQIYEQNLAQHNTLNIYNQLVADGRMDVNPQYEALRRALGPTIAEATYGSQYISYDQYKANNFIQGLSNVQFGGPVATTNDISTLFGATGSLSLYPHREIDWATVSGTNVSAMLWNDRTTVAFANYGSEYANTAQGNMVGLETVVSYMYKGQMREDTILHRYMHLNGNQRIETESSVQSLSMIIGQTGNSGQWNGAGYAAHLHADVSVGVTRSPLLDQMARNYESPRTTNYLYPIEQRVYYDPMMFLNNLGYTVRPNAGAYNSW